MDQLRGVIINNNDIRGLQKVADLVYFEGPLLSIFEDKYENKFLWYWVDADDKSNRWLILRITERQLAEYINKDITLKEIIANPIGGYVYSVDVYEEPEKGINFANTIIISPNDLPITYKPKENSFYMSEPIYYQLEESGLYKIPIEGNWSLVDLSNFPNIFSQVYAFIYSISDHFWEEVKTQMFSLERIEYAFRGFPWRGGYSAVNFYKKLKSNLPEERRPKVARLLFASPGVIGLRLYNPVADQITNSIKAFINNSDEVSSLYTEIYGYLKDKKLLRDVDTKAFYGEPEVSEVLARYYKELASLLLVSNEQTERIIGLTEDNYLCSLKIILSYYRRIRDLAAFERKGKAKYV